MRYGHHSLGPLELLVLRAVTVPLSGAEIMATMEVSLGRTMQRDAIYTVLRRLQSKGYVASNNTRPRNYWATEDGKSAIDQADKTIPT